MLYHFAVRATGPGHPCESVTHGGGGELRWKEQRKYSAAAVFSLWFEGRIGHGRISSVGSLLCLGESRPPGTSLTRVWLQCRALVEGAALNRRDLVPLRQCDMIHGRCGVV